MRSSIHLSGENVQLLSVLSQPFLRGFSLTLCEKLGGLSLDLPVICRYTENGIDKDLR